MNRIFARWLPCATLAAWSAILLYFYESGRIKAFLIPAFRPYVLAAGILMALMAAIFIFLPAEGPCCSSAECGHPLSRSIPGQLLTFLILLLPMTTAAFFSPDAFGKAAMESRGIITDAASLGGAARRDGTPAPVDLPLPTNGDPNAPASVAATPPSQEPTAPPDYLERTPEGVIVAEVLDLLYAAQDNVLRKDFENKAVQLIGQLMPDTGSNGSGKRFKVVRMFMTCCAADARPVATLVEADKLPDLPEMTWVKVVGTSTFPVENGRRTALLKATLVEKTSPPEESMLY